MSITKRNFLKAVSCAYFFYSFKALTKDNQPIGNYIPAKDKNTWPSKVHRVEEFYTSTDSDYSDAITKGINYCSLNNGALLFSDKYKISRSIILPDNTYIMGKEGSLLYCDADKPISIFLATSKKILILKA